MPRRQPAPLSGREYRARGSGQIGRLLIYVFQALNRTFSGLNSAFRRMNTPRERPQLDRWAGRLTK